MRITPASSSQKKGSTVATWHVQTTRDSNTNIETDGPPIFKQGGNIWEFSKSNKVVFVIPREHVLYIKSIP